MVKIQFSDLGSMHKEISKEIDQAVKKVIKRGDFILGEDVRLFENEFAVYCQSKYAIGVSSGTAALFLSLVSLGIGKNDEVIIPDFTFIATALAVSYTGAKPIFVDIDKDTYNIDVKALEKVVTKNTKAIIPVHIFGQPANMSEVLKFAKAYKLKVIEDAAQAHGATIRMEGNKWKKTGCMGDLGCFSFYPSKNLGALGDGGIIVTDNEDIYKKLLILRDCGRISKYEHAIIGYNSRLDTLHAAVLRIKLKYLDKWNDLRQNAAREYNCALKTKINIITPYVVDNVKHVYHVYAVRVKNRDFLLDKLIAKGIVALVHYPIPLHLQHAYKDLGYKPGDFPVSEIVSKEIMSLPMHPYLTKSQIRYITQEIE